MFRVPCNFEWLKVKLVNIKVQYCQYIFEGKYYIYFRVMSITTSTIPLTASSSIMSDVNLSKELMRDLQFMQLALQQAELALHVEEIPVGCVIILDNKVIASGYNQTNITRNGTK